MTTVILLLVAAALFVLLVAVVKNRHRIEEKEDLKEFRDRFRFRSGSKGTWRHGVPVRMMRDGSIVVKRSNHLHTVKPTDFKVKSSRLPNKVFRTHLRRASA